MKIFAFGTENRSPEFLDDFWENVRTAIRPEQLEHCPYEDKAEAFAILMGPTDTPLLDRLIATGKPVFAANVVTQPVADE